MADIGHQNERRFLIPEVVQTSAMDCGPASLKALLEGFGISVSYGRLREACQTSVDGTSIDTIEDVANQLGLNAEQIMVPADHLLLSAAQVLPAIVVVRLSSGLTHFVVVWRQHGGFLQLMDPGTGRRWPRGKNFLKEIYIHTYPVPAVAWREWAGTEGFLDPLKQRLANLQIEPEQYQPWLETARADPLWYSIAALDASIRMLDSLFRAGGIERGQEAADLLDRFLKRGIEQAQITEWIAQQMMENGEAKDIPPLSSTIPALYWCVQPHISSGELSNTEPHLALRGAVLVRVTSDREISPSSDQKGSDISSSIAISNLSEAQDTEEEKSTVPLSPELVAALNEAPIQPLHEIWRIMRQDGLLAPSMVILALVVASIGVLLEALLFQGVLQISSLFPLIGQRTIAIGMFFVFFLLLASVEIPLNSAIMRMGRKLETRLRIAFLEKLPKLSDRYFHSRLVSDMTQRAHELRMLRMLPDIGENFLRVFFQLILTTLGIIILDPISAPLALLSTGFFIALAIITKPFLDERDLRVRTHLGALDRFYLDALLGLLPIRTHGAERAIRREHENLLVEWVHASFESLRLGRNLQVISAICYSIFAIWLVLNYILKGGQSSGILLLFYWTLHLPALGQNLVMLIQQYPMQRNAVLRILEPINAPDESESCANDAKMDTSYQPINTTTSNTELRSTIVDTQQNHSRNGSPIGIKQQNPIRIEMKNVSIKASGHLILSDINISIQAGEHIGIVGPSGAGKSSFVGLFLGWHRSETGKILIDGIPLSGEYLQILREQTAWVDPAVQIWNRSLLSNLEYGAAPDASSYLRETIESAELFEILTKLPDGLQTVLGESGGLVSGGEGQRVRLGRAMLRSTARLVILDEPFRGLDREKRRKLLLQARSHWQTSTLFCVTHDVSETQAFPRVLVIEDGKIIEDDSPSHLVEDPNSRYLALLKAEEDVRLNLWESSEWRRLWIEDGQLKEDK